MSNRGTHAIDVKWCAIDFCALVTLKYLFSVSLSITICILNHEWKHSDRFIYD